MHAPALHIAHETIKLRATIAPAALAVIDVLTHDLPGPLLGQEAELLDLSLRMLVEGRASGVEPDPGGRVPKMVVHDFGYARMRPKMNLDRIRRAAAPFEEPSEALTQDPHPAS